MTDTQLFDACGEVRGRLHKLTATREGRRLLKAFGITLDAAENLDALAEDFAKTQIHPGISPNLVWIEWVPGTFQPRPWFCIQSDL